MDPINLWIPKSIKRATGKESMPTPLMRVLPGLHKGKTAVITGGSLGIGLQLGRYLAIAGCRVLLSARSAPSWRKRGTRSLKNCAALVTRKPRRGSASWPTLM